MEDSQLFCVAEERSGHCAVVDGNFLYVWGGYVVRGRGGTGQTRVGSPPGVSDRADAERPPTPGPEAGAGARPRLSATRASPAPPLSAALLAVQRLGATPRLLPL